MGAFEDYVRSVADSLPEADPRGLAAGQHEGLVCLGPARLRPRDDETEKHHSGYLLGHLIRWMHARGRPLDTTLLPATCYGAAIAHAQSQRLMAKEHGAVLAHMYAALLTEKHLEAQIPDDVERMLYGWLCEQAEVVVTPGMVARLERLRSRRHEKYGRHP